MRIATAILSLMILGLTMAPGVTAQTPGCDEVGDDSDVSYDGLYVVAGDGEVWEEDNAVDGLQRDAVTCVTDNGRTRTFPADVQIV